MNNFERYRCSIRFTGIYALIAGLLLTGCTSRDIINRAGDRNEPKSLSITQFNREVKDKSLTIRLRNGFEYDAEDISVSIDSTSFRAGGNGIKISNDSIRYYLWKNHVGGAGEGFLLSIIPAILLTQKGEFNDAEFRILPVLPAYVCAGVITIASAVAGKSCYYEFLSDTVKFSNNSLNVRASTEHNGGNNDAGNVRVR